MTAPPSPLPSSDPPPATAAPDSEAASLEGVLEQAARWRQQGHRVALATVVKTWGSSPRPAGSQLAVRDDGAMVGSVSGGCIEGAVVGEALAAIEAGAAGQPRLLAFGITNDMAWEVGLACGGRVEVFVEVVE